MKSNHALFYLSMGYFQQIGPILKNAHITALMEFLALLLIFYFFVGACICLIMCVNPNDPGLLGFLNRTIYHKLPAAFSSIIKKIFGDGILKFFTSIKVYLMETNHPIVQYFYLLIAVGGFITYSITGIFKHMPNEAVGDYQVILANMLAIICFWIYYKACATSPGQIKQQNVKQFVQKYRQYYDGVLYKKDNKCTTCNLVKPARSKHCSICKMCVSKYDHHCIWIRQCVGEKNYKYFVLFLGLHSVWCLYLSLIGTVSLLTYLQKMKFWTLSFNIGGEIVKADNLVALQFLFMTQTVFFFLIVMCLIMGVTLFIFVGYHFYLISQGQTTNERVKKNDFIAYYTKQIKTCQKLQKQFVDEEGKKKEFIQFKEEKVTEKEIIDYQSECNRKLALLDKAVQKKGFFHNMNIILKA